MFRGGLGNAVVAPASEVLSRILAQAVETALAAKDVLIEQRSFMELSTYLEKILPILNELKDKNVRNTPPMRVAMDSLDREIKAAKELIHICSTKSRFYLLCNCRNFIKQLQQITNEIGRCLSLIPMATLDISVDSRDRTERLCKEMRNVQFKAAVAEEEIVNKIDIGIKERRADSDYANDLLLQIAQVVGVPVDPLSLKKELLEFKKEKEEAELRKSQAEAMQLEQIIAFLSQADSAHSPSEKDGLYQEKKSRTGAEILPPLQSFYCPITCEVMEDPVETASAQTFERDAIEKWFASGNKTCPLTKVELETLELKPNLSLRNSIREWRERNIIMSIGATGSRLQSGNEEEITSALIDLRQLSEEKAIHRDWIRADGLIPVIVNLLNSNNRTIRKNVLDTLFSVAVNNDENKEKIADAGAVALAVRSLAREVGEGRQAVALLLELSKILNVCDQIGKVQGCILLLVTLLNSGNQYAANDARELLSNLSHNNQNVVQMAEANHFKPLVQHLIEGSDKTKILMATALSRMGLTDQSKATLAQEGAILPLVKMISVGKLEMKSAGLAALQNLSNVPENRDHLINAGVIPPLLQLLFSVTSVAVSLKEQAAITFANIAASMSYDLGVNHSNSILDSDETIYQLLSLLNLAGPGIQGHVLRALLGISCPSSAIRIRNKMREGGAIQLLLPFCEVSDIEVRINAVKLLSCLCKDGIGRDLSEHFGPTYITALVKLLSSTREEKTAAAGVIANLPVDDAQITETLVQSDALPLLVEILNINGSSNFSNLRTELIENVLGALIRFTTPSDIRLQQRTAEQDVIPRLVHLLDVGSPLAKSRAATILGQLSESTSQLSSPVNNSRGCCMFLSKPEKGCRIHGGHCSVRSSFCLIEADAISPLIRILEEKEAGADEAAISALATLLYDETWEAGAQVIAETDGILPVVRLLTVGNPGAKEKAVWMLERIFRIDRYVSEFGSQAQMPLVDLTQKGSSSTRSVAAKVLAHLQVLHNQSSYF